MTKSRDLGDIAQTVATSLPTALGTAGQTLVVNSAADGLEFGAASGGGSGVTSYTAKSGTDGTPSGATYIDNVSSPSEGDLAYDLAADQLYIRTTSAWKRISIGVDESPIVTTEPPTTHELNPDGTTSTVTMVATDPEGFDITYGIAYPTANNALPDQLATATSINQSTGVFTFDPSTTDTDAGNVKVRLSASDGISTTTRFCTLNLKFSVDILTTTTSGFNSNGTNSFDYTVAQTNNNSSKMSSTLQLGKRYLEVVRGNSNPYMFVGIRDATGTNQDGYTDSGTQSIYCFNSNIRPSNTSTGLTDAKNTGDIVMIAYDTSTREVWFGVNGSWYQDPSTTSSSFTVSGASGSTPQFQLMFGNGSSASVNYTGTINVGSNVTYTVPTGFEAH